MEDYSRAEEKMPRKLMRKLTTNCILVQVTRSIICVPILWTTHVVVGELKTKSSKNLFRKLNEHSKELWAKQEEIIKKHNSLAAQYEELEHLKVNMNDYLGHNKTEKKKESVIGTIMRQQVEDKEKPKEKKEASKEAER